MEYFCKSIYYPSIVALYCFLMCTVFRQSFANGRKIVIMPKWDAAKALELIVSEYIFLSYLFDLIFNIKSFCLQIGKGKDH